MLESILQADQDLFIWLNSLGSEQWDAFWLLVTDEFTFVPLYAILLFLIYKKLGLKTMLLLILVIAAMITFTDQITNLFKHTVKRPRPCRVEEISEMIRFLTGSCGRYGFFSGHSSNSMAAAVFAGLLLRKHYKHLIFIMLFWSALVAYSRIYVGVHYPLDIFFGMSFGSFAGFIFYKLQLHLRKRFIAS